ncbi:hypothetical protein EI94DRAFT_1704732 [Lactarius quietus]|nr:hypothetical protein EI94DRAFT_1704732 [Lactarius quietus]
MSAKWHLARRRLSLAPQTNTQFCHENGNLKANNAKSNLILNLLSWVDFLEPAYCIFENVRGPLAISPRLTARRSLHRRWYQHGWPQVLVHAMLAMNYQFCFCLFQAAHYGTPLTCDGDIARAVHTKADAAPFRFVSIDNAVSNLLLNVALANMGMQDEPELASPVGQKHACGVAETYGRPAAFLAGAKARYCRYSVINILLIAHADYWCACLFHTLPSAEFVTQHWRRSIGNGSSHPASAIMWKGFHSDTGPSHFPEQTNLPFYFQGLYGRLDKDYIFQMTVTNVKLTTKQSRVLSPYTSIHQNGLYWSTA